MVETDTEWSKFIRCKDFKIFLSIQVKKSKHVQKNKY